MRLTSRGAGVLLLRAPSGRANARYNRRAPWTGVGAPSQTDDTHVGLLSSRCGPSSSTGGRTPTGWQKESKRQTRREAGTQSQGSPRDRPAADLSETVAVSRQDMEVQMPYIIRPVRIRTFGAGVLAAALLSAAVPAVASAACAAQPLSQPFSSIGDNATYALVQDGNFESGGAGWSIAKSEVISEVVPVTGGKHALVVKPGGRVVSPAFCVGNEYPSFRFMLRQVKGGGKMNVALIWTDGSGQQQEALTDELEAGSSWSASPVEQLASTLGLHGSQTVESVRLVFTSTHPGLAVAISGVYIDPYSR
jgi:hypothetical protein